MSKKLSTLAGIQNQVKDSNFNVAVLPIILLLATSIVGQLLQSKTTPCGLVDQCSEVNLQTHITH
jgi:hypothetical protein